MCSDGDERALASDPGDCVKNSRTQAEQLLQASPSRQNALRKRIRPSTETQLPCLYQRVVSMLKTEHAAGAQDERAARRVGLVSQVRPGQGSPRSERVLSPQCGRRGATSLSHARFPLLCRTDERMTHSQTCPSREVLTKPWIFL